MTRFAAVRRPDRPWSRWLWPATACLLVLIIGLLLLRLPARAASPLDHRSTAPNQSSELPGAGYLLTDPSQGPSRAYWAGAYRTIPGARAYCVDDFYDYPNASYGYRTPEVSHWSGRPGSNNGAQGHTAQRIIWIVNSYGQSTAASTDAAVSMAINVLTGSAPFLRSYASSFVPQLNALNPAIVGFINKMIADSDRYAGPYRTQVAFGSAPAVGATGHLTVQVRSARGFALPNVPFRLTATAGLQLRSPGWGRTGPSGVATLVYTALRSGSLAAVAQGTAVPNTTMRLGYSPTHDTGNFSTGSQRVALVSAHRLSLVAPGTAHTTVHAPSIRTVVRGGSTGRPVGAKVTDQVQATGLQPRAEYRLAVTLADAVGSVCGSVTTPVRADAHGLLDTITPPITTCGGGRNTFSERLLDVHGHPVVTSPPGQPKETFPITPSTGTAVLGGVRGRPVATAVSDQVRTIGLWPSRPYRVRADLQDSSGQPCGSLTVAGQSDRHGVLALTLGPIKVCGAGRNTFVERVTDSSGTVVATTSAGQPTETFPVLPPVPHRPTPSKPTPSKPTPSKPTPPKPTPPQASPPKPNHPAAKPPAPKRPTAAPQLPYTGASPQVALLTGILGVLAGGLLLAAGRRGL